LRENNRKKYPEIKEGDTVKYFHKKKDNYINRKETNRRWSEKAYKVEKIKLDIMGNRTYQLEGLSKSFINGCFFNSPVCGFSMNQTLGLK
jgi:hypothetical protein